MQEKYLPQIDQLVPPEVDQLPRLERVFSAATVNAAVSAHQVIEDAYSSGRQLNAPEIRALKIEIDAAAVEGMSQVLHNQHEFCVHSVGSEGAKEVLHDGAEAPRMNGSYGRKHMERVDKVSDAVEGTVAAAHNLPGAVSVAAASEVGGLMPSQDGQFYLEKLFGPPQLAGYLSLDLPPEENIARALRIMGIPPEELTVVILNRDRNLRYIQAADSQGVNVRLINAGDLMPSLLSVADPNIHSAGVHLVMGIGGFEEGIIAAAAAKTQGGLAETRRWSTETKDFFDGILTVDDMVPGDAAKTLVSVTSITGDEWFGLWPVSTEENGTYLANSMVITQNGYDLKWTSLKV